jgi:rhodanese-related sulfurtransferase
MSGFSSIDAHALAELLAQRGSFELVDVRNPDEVARGVIEGARHIPLGLLTQRFQELERDRPVIFYCQSGMRSMQASAFLSARGWPEVFNLVGGVMAWARSGLPLTKLDDNNTD